MIKLYPVEIDAYDTETKDEVFKVKAFDEAVAEVTISACVNVALWDEIAPKIREALSLLDLEGDDDKRQDQEV